MSLLCLLLSVKGVAPHTSPGPTLAASQSNPRANWLFGVELLCCPSVVMVLIRTSAIAAAIATLFGARFSEAQTFQRLGACPTFGMFCMIRGYPNLVVGSRRSHVFTLTEPMLIVITRLHLPA